MGRAKSHGRGSHLLAVAAAVLALASGALGARVATSLVAAASVSPALTFSAPVTVGTNEISGISCPTRAFCAAVDPSGDVLTSTNPSGGAAAWTAAKIDTQGLTGVSCPSMTLCVAGDSFGRALTSTDPSGGAAAWTLTTVASGAFMFGPSCPSVSFCAFSAEGQGVVTSTNPTGGAAAWAVTALADFNTNGVACPTASLCVLSDNTGNVLTSTNPTGGSTAWVTASVDANGQGLRAISCASASLCATADGAGQVVTSTNPRGGSANFWSVADVDASNTFNAISCPSTAPSLCLAVDGAGNVLSSTAPTAGAGAWAVQNVFGSTPATAAGCADNAFCVVGDSHGDIAVGTGSAGGPAVTGIAPAQGPTAGGASVTISGTGFSTAPGATAVDFGATSATGVSCSSTTSCTAVAPTGAPAVVNVTATVAGITSAAGPLNSFTYVAPGPPPAISTLSPAAGPAGGGTSVTITGSGFDTTPGATSVTFGGLAANNVSCSGTTSCVATDPPGIGPQIVIATVAGQTSSGSSASTFGYRPPIVNAISPSNGSTAGGTAVTLSGANFDTVPGTMRVTFGSLPAAVTCSSATTCTATSPPGTGAVFLSVSEGPVTTPPASALSFTYVAPPVETLSCGATVTQSVTLTQDLGPCPGNGLVVQASGITVDLEGHRIFGAADSSDNRVGIELAAVTGVTVTGSAGKATVLGDVDGFASGVSIDGGSHNTIAKLDVHDNVGPQTFAANRGDGIVIGSVVASSHNVISNSVVAHNGVYDGVGVFSAQSKGNQILNTQVTDNNISVTVPDSVMVDDGVNLGSGLEGSNNTTISGDTISRNGYNGIDACSAEGTPPCSSVGNVITSNVIEANGTPGQVSHGINISVLVPSLNPFPGTFDTVSGNQVLDNLGLGIFFNNPNNTITNNVALGNDTDPVNIRDLGGAFDLYDNTNGCTHNNWHGNTFDMNEAFPACTTKGGTASQPSSTTGMQTLTPAPPRSWRRGQLGSGFTRGG